MRRGHTACFAAHAASVPRTHAQEVVEAEARRLQMQHQIPAPARGCRSDAGRT